MEHFAASAPADRHFTIDAYAGEVRFGPAVRQPDGTLRHHGAVPPTGAAIRDPAVRRGRRERAATWRRARSAR